MSLWEWGMLAIASILGGYALGQVYVWLIKRRIRAHHELKESLTHTNREQ